MKKHTPFRENRRVLITGASGLVGSALTRVLQQQGNFPVLLARNPMPPDKAASLGIDPAKFIYGDVSKPHLGLAPETYKKLSNKIDTIFHLAARVDFKGRQVDDYRPVNIDGTRHTIQLARDSGADLHYTSTAFICGTSTSFKEQQFDISQQFHNCYEESKFLAEREVRSFIETSHGQANIYRLAIILGRDAASSQSNIFGPFFFMEAVFRMLLATRKDHTQEPLRILGNPQGHLPMLFAKQTAEALVALATEKTSGKTYHLVPKKPLLNHTLEKLFNQAFGRQVVQWAAQEDFDKRAANRAENILRKKISAYADYLDLHMDLGRKHLESSLGADILPCPDEDEFLAAFADFLAAKESGNVVTHSSSTQAQISDYFESFLPEFYGRQMLKNLVSLNADFWIEIDGGKTWSLQIKQGRLKSVKKDAHNGSFGYRIEPENYLRIVRAEMSPQEGFFRGVIKLNGNNIEALRTATALEEFFKNFPYCRKS